MLALIILGPNTVTAESETVALRGDTITITVTLLQNTSYGNPVPDQRIYFFDQTFDTLIGSDKTDANGVVSIPWNIPSNHALGPTTINATFYGNKSLSLAPSCQWTILTILSSTNIEINQVPELLAPGDLLSISVHLTDDSNTSIPNATVTVFKDDIPLAAGITNLSGNIHFDIMCNSSWIELGDNHIRVVYYQDPVNFYDTSEFTFILKISKIQTSIIPQNTFPTEIKLSEFVELYVELSETNYSMPNESLQLFLDDSPLLFSISNSSGIAYFHINIDERFTLGIHSLKIHYNGTERYSESYYESLFLVTSPAQIFIGVPESVEIGSSAEIVITASDLLGRVIPNSLISFFDTISNQRFTIPCSPTETTINFQYEVQGPAGIHTLNIEITENLFITNTSSSSILTVWSTPSISLVNCNVEHYAYPSQEVLVQIQMTDWAGNCSFRLLQLLIDGEIQQSNFTDTNGRLNFSLSVPNTEKQYNISLFYNGNNTLFELPVKFDYYLQVTSQMPARLELDYYEISVPLHKLSIHLTLRGLNGSTLNDVQVDFSWLSSNINAETTDGGLILLHLRIPVESGSYVLYYESETTNSVISTSGSFIIEITMSDIMLLQGVGIIGLSIALIASIGISTVPLIRRRYLVG
ncbi:MAG: hypothetical protein ACFFBL_08265 [Promethearchaeota archaeon]